MFTTDLKLSYGHLRSTCEKLKSYYALLDAMAETITDVDEFLGEQTSHAIVSFRDLISGSSGLLQELHDRSAAVQDVANLLENYITDMSSLVAAQNEEQITRVDRNDICYNKDQIRSSYDALACVVRLPAEVVYSGYGAYSEPHTNRHTSLTPEEEQERQKRIRNYTKLENLRTQTLLPALSEIEASLDVIDNIYNNSIAPFEDLDDEYEDKAEDLYDKHPKVFHYWENLFGDIASVTGAALKALAVAAVVVVVGIVAPEILVGLAILAAGGAVYVAAAPQEYVPENFHELRQVLRDTATDGPEALVEYIGQGIMDEIQTPEGIASVAVDVLTLPVGGGAVAKAGKFAKGAKAGGSEGSLILKYEFNGITNPGPLPRIDEIAAASMRSGMYNVGVYDKPTRLFRAGDGKNALGQYFSETPPKSVIDVRINKAVKPYWTDNKGNWTGSSPLNTTYEVEVPPGTKYFKGPIGNQGDIYIGGDEQIFIQKPWEIVGIKIIGSKPLE